MTSIFGHMINDDADAARNLLRYCAEEMEHVDESINGAFLGWHYGLEVYL